jgi:hypothetical protein
MSHNRRGHGARPLLEHEIRAAQSIADSAKHAAELLEVSYNTYKKWAKRYGVHDFFNMSGKGTKKVHHNPKRGKYPLDDIIAGMYPEYPTDRFKKKLFDSGYKEEKCENCGFCEKRVTDDKSPLLIDYLDEDAKNKSLENIRILCYNCTFLVGRGYLTRGSNLVHNPEKLQSPIGRYKKTPKVEVEPEEDEMEFDLDELTEEERKQLEDLHREG